MANENNPFVSSLASHHRINMRAVSSPFDPNPFETESDNDDSQYGDKIDGKSTALHDHQTRKRVKSQTNDGLTKQQKTETVRFFSFSLSLFVPMYVFTLLIHLDFFFFYFRPLTAKMTFPQMTFWNLKKV